jgi:glycosyltransferase involved in cell wall biosynthesis
MEKLKIIGPPRTISIVVPIYNEQDVIEALHKRLLAVTEKVQNYTFELVYVDDGSRDASLSILRTYLLDGPAPVVQVVSFSRNFGKEAATTAGIEHANGDAVIIIDADMQDPPELISEMIAAWEKGFEVVHMQRTNRDGESFLKKATAHLFYKLMRSLSEVDVPENVGDFRLMSRSAVDSLLRLPERTRFMKGLFAWVGFKSCTIPYHRDARYAGVTKWNYWKLWNFALEGITSFTVAPLKIASYTGMLISLLSLLAGGFFFIKTLLYGDPVPGFPSLIIVILFLGGLQLLAIGIVGEYLGRIFVETKQRPLYVKGDHLQSNTRTSQYESKVLPNVAKQKNIQ